jgi:hypothetical protein
MNQELRLCDSDILQFLRNRGALNRNIGNRIELQPTPYGRYTKHQLDMRRKVEILKNTSAKSQTNKQTVSQQYASAVTRNRSIRQQLAESTPETCPPNELRPTPTSASDIPGPIMILQYDPTVPLYNYVNNVNAYSEFNEIIQSPQLYVLPLVDNTVVSSDDYISTYYYFSENISGTGSGRSRNLDFSSYSSLPISTSMSNMQSREMDQNVYVYVSNVVANIYYKNTLIKSSAN